jgi:hypothetical protein
MASKRGKQATRRLSDYSWTTAATLSTRSSTPSLFFTFSAVPASPFMFQSLPSATPFSFRPCSSWLISYATGRLDLGVINQVNEGLLMIAIVAIVGGILGNEVWTQPSFITGINWAETFIYPMYALIIIVSFIQSGNQISPDHQGSRPV